MPFTLHLLALAVFVMGTSEFMLAGLLPAIADDLGVPLGTTGLLTSAFAVGMVVGAPAMAAFARRWPQRRVLLLCLLVFAGCHVAAALTPLFALLLAARVLSALANAGFLAVALSTATSLVPDHRKGRALAVLLSGTTVAMVVGVPAGSLLGALAGWRATFWTIAALCVPAALGILRGVADSPARSGADLRVPTLRTELASLASPRLIGMMSLAALVNAGTFAALTYLAPLVTEVAALDVRWISVALVLFGIGSFLGVSVAGRLSDHRPVVTLSVGVPLLLVGWITLAVFSSHPALALMLVLIVGTLSFGVGSTLIAQVLHASSDAPTMGGSYATVALNVGAAAGPLLGALALTSGIGATAPVWTAAALTALTLAILIPSRRQLALPGGQPPG